MPLLSYSATIEEGTKALKMPELDCEFQLRVDDDERRVYLEWDDDATSGAIDGGIIVFRHRQEDEPRWTTLSTINLMRGSIPSSDTRAFVSPPAPQENWEVYMVEIELEMADRNLETAAGHLSVVALDQAPNNVCFEFPRLGRSLWAIESFLRAASPHFEALLSSEFSEGITTTEQPSSTPGESAPACLFDVSDEETDSFSSVKRVPQVTQDRFFSPYKRVKIMDTCFTTYQAVLLWLQTGHIVFAPLRSSFLPPSGTFSPPHAWTPRQDALRALHKTKDARLPPPASPKSVYRLADLLSLDPLKSVALANYISQLTPRNAAYELYSDIAGCYAPVRDAIVDYVVDCWDEVRDMPATHETEGRAERDELPAGAAKTAMLLARRLAERAE
ncbi:hypothetical protein JCM10450v2_001145 [Rhodotorula kratochvilovae]